MAPYMRILPETGSLQNTVNLVTGWQCCANYQAKDNQMITDTYTYWMIDNLLEWFWQANKQQLEDGINWYKEAGEIAAEYTARTGKSLDVIAGIMAVYSANMSWGGNKKLLKNFVDAMESGDTTQIGMGFVYKKALALWHNNDLSVIKGKKTIAFWHSICGRPAACVDRWAARAATQGQYDRAPVGMEYARQSFAYNRAAEFVGLPVHKFQAVVWIVIRQHSVNIPLD